MMALRFVSKGKKKKSSGKFSLPNCCPWPESTSGKAAEAQCKGNKINSREIQEDLKQQQKNIYLCERTDEWFLSGTYLLMGYPQMKKKLEDLLDYFCCAGTAKGFLLSFLLHSVYQDGPRAWSSSAGFCRNLAWVRITCGKAAQKKLWSSSYLQGGTFHF